MYDNDLHLTSDAQFAVKTPRCVGCTMYNALCCAVLYCPVHRNMLRREKGADQLQG